MLKPFSPLVISFFVAACGKGEAPRSTSAPTTAPATTAPATNAQATTTPPIPAKPPELAERKGQISFEAAARRRRVDFTMPAPVGWEQATFDGKPVDGRDAMYQIAAPGADEQRPYMLVSGGQCSGPCTLETFDAEWVKAPPLRKDEKLVRRELLATGHGISVVASPASQLAIVERLIPGDAPVTLQCMAEVFETTPDMFTSLVDACTKLVVGSVSDVLGGELLASEQAKLANCPAVTTVTYTPPTAGAAFGEVKKAIAYQTQGSILTLAFANSDGANLYGGEPGEGAMRIDATIIAAQGGEVTSGTYTIARDRPTLTEVALFGAKPPADDEIVIVEPGEGLSWSGPDVKVEVVARTQDRVCGRFHFKDASHEAKGEFNLDLKVGKSIQP